MGIRSSLEPRLQRDGRKVVILDDDPTGTQTVSEVSVILHPSLDAYRRFFASKERSAYILTNTRAIPKEQAVALIQTIRAEVEQAAREASYGVAFLLRGDSTLRGHVFAEMDALGEGKDSWVGLFVPAFPEGGRITRDGIQYLLLNGEQIPVAQTEFAKDTTFGYQSERLVDWVAEVGAGRAAIALPLQQLHEYGANLIYETLMQAPAGTIIVPDAESRADLEMIAQGLLEAEEAGRNVVVRSASTFAAVRAGLRGKDLNGSTEVDGSLLVVCGSHTRASSQQLERLVDSTIAPVVIPTDWLLREGLDAVVPRLAQRLLADLEEHKFAILTTERVRRPEHSDLSVGAQVMEALTTTVSRVAQSCDGVIVKGGISSAQVATDGFGAVNARVLGQLEAGVSLWYLHLPDGRSLPYAVVPGNVGSELTLLNIAQQFEAMPLVAQKKNYLSATLQPIEQRSLVAEITQRLLDYLLSGEIKPGSRLPSERQLSDALGMGRSTLRESLKALTLLGLLEVRQGDGTYLRRADSALLPRVIEWGMLLGEKRTMDLVEARLKIEVVIVELAALRRDSYAVEELRKLLKRMEVAGTNYQEFMDADVAFHLKLAEIASNTILRDILSSIQGLLRAWIGRVIESAGKTDFSYREHLAIFDAVEQGDPQAAVAAMQAHMDSAQARLLKTIEQS